MSIFCENVFLTFFLLFLKLCHKNNAMTFLISARNDAQAEISPFFNLIPILQDTSYHISETMLQLILELG